MSTFDEFLKPEFGEGVLILGSGNIVHNLRLASPLETSYPWAAAFDRSVQERILSGNHEDLIHYQKLGEPAQFSIPTNEHYLPMLYTLAVQEKGEVVQFFAEGFTYGSISMRSFRIG